MTDAEMSAREVETFSNRGQWVTRVIDEPELSQSFSSRDEAVEAGERLAARLGTSHRVVESEPEGTITDQETAADADAASPRASRGGEQDLPPTTDDDGMPVENPSG
ncbi:DUF2188 domain-containing protein [Microbacterium sp. BK668]|uniref:DUF2188 domain-containing protein n=1 Tax=Microbacterium sp. BK668 TaxID=2512118 RepID=UPI0010D7AC9F|nr:DUF2188 domain-containing protein [Microbacterium sp. BK668]TDN92020.1 uncharacterized protein DUF2188 [Microbacterium sp. BK668]